MRSHTLPEVYTARDVARAAGVPDSDITSLVASGEIRTVASLLPGAADPRWAGYIPHAEAVRVVRALKRGESVAVRDPEGVSRLLVSGQRKRSTTVPLLLSTSIHAVVAMLLLVIGSLGLTNAEEPTELVDKAAEPIRLVFLATPGPGGGGGGGGLRMPTPAPRAERRAPKPKPVSSPIPARRLPPPMRPAPKPVEPPPAPLEARTLPPVMAPVAPVAADTRDREGVMQQAPKEAPPSQGPGVGGGAGSGQGTGLGQGNGSGIGPGEGGGMGGGPYRPGSGVTPPQIIREVRAQYTDEARRAGVTGEVELEVVVRRDGTVGDVKILRRLGSGLDQRAVEAVRQWRFSPARLKGTPVDVIVEISVEFKLR